MNKLVIERTQLGSNEVSLVLAYDSDEGIANYEVNSSLNETGIPNTYMSFLNAAANYHYQIEMVRQYNNNFK